MSQRLTVELSDEVYNIIQRQATEANISPAQVVLASLEQYFHEQHEQDEPSGAPRRVRARSVRKKAELQVARERFERHFGTVDLGYPTGASNEEIDADLESEYANVDKRA